MRLAVLFLAVLVAACSTTPNGERAERLGVQLLVMNRVIEKAPQPEAKAREVLASVQELQSLVDFESVSIADLRAALLKRIGERELTPSEKLAALELTQVISDELEGRIGAGVLSPEHKVAVRKVLGWVEAAALVYVSD